ncbi:MAG TPA: glycosyltransferase [Chitinophaga sp.]
MRKQTLVILTPAFPENESPEASIWLPAKQSLVRCLNRNFPEVELVILSFQFPVSRTPYRWNGNQVIPFGGGNRRHGHNWLVWLRVFKTLLRLRKEKQLIGLLSCWCAECCFVAHYFSKLYRVKHLCWICGQDARRPNRFVKRTRPAATELVAMSDFLVDEFYKNHRIRPAHLIPDAVDPALFDTTLKARTIDILGAGSLSPLKRYDRFVEIVGAVRERIPHLQARLCGDGTEMKTLRQQIQGARLTGTLALTGTLPQQALLALMQQTKVFLHTSSYEGFGNVCIEALYAGAHVISFTRPMHQDIPHWHTVATQEEMTALAVQLLEDNGTEYTPVLPFNMNDSARQFMQLFRAAGQHSTG